MHGHLCSVCVDAAYSPDYPEKDGTWKNARLTKGDIAEEITKLKQQPAKDISISGSVNLIQALMRLGLLDELRLQGHPVALGSDGSKPVFEGFEKTNLILLGTTVLDSRGDMVRSCGLEIS